jgi:prepilin-type N-terminal cleavage/methylation domain-containing protein
VHRKSRRQSGFTLIELMIVTGIVGIMVLIGFVGMQSWLRNQRSKEIARQFANSLMVSRAEAIRSRDPVVVFFNTDKDDNSLVDGNGDAVAALAIRDLNGNGYADNGEQFKTVRYPVPGSLSWGHAMATDRAVGDPGGTAGSPPSAPFTFDKPDGSGATWVAFLPDGTPRAYVDDSLAGTGSVGSGAGAIYVTSGDRDYAIVLTPLGSVQVQVWDAAAGAWKR